MQSHSGIGVCIVDENEAVPFDRRAWMEACALTEAGFRVSVICPTVGKATKWRESISGVEIYRYPAFKATGRFAHLIEYAWALVAQFLLSCRVYAKTRFHILQACNPPDTIFLIALLLKPLGVRFVFDHHDLSPELFALRFSRQGILYRLVCIAERLSLRTADLCIATNETFREIAVSRGRMDPHRVVVVQSCAANPERKEETPPVELKNGYSHMVLYVGQMEPQDGVELLLKSIRCIIEQWQRKDTLFVLLGSELARLRAQAGSWDHAHQLVFGGRVPHAEVCRYLAACDVCVVPDPPKSIQRQLFDGETIRVHGLCEADRNVRPEGRPSLDGRRCVIRAARQ